ncbi:MAG: hypothetical protein OEU93_18545, partial [Rubrivivax sp.]|nr:hypothetical protein [Rubrivivax sp.]
GVALGPDVPIDISHESLMRVWERLRGWTEDEAQSAQTYRRLAETAELYPKRANLIGPPELQVALAWRERRRPNAAWARRYRAGFDAAMAFLDASAEADEAARRADAARREEAARLRQAQARAKQNRVWMAIVLPLSIGAAAGMAWLAWQARVEKLAADQERDAAKVQAAEAVRQAEQIRQEKARAEAALAELRRLEVSQQAQAQVLERVKEAAPQLLTTIQKATQGQSLVYLQYADDRQKALVERLRAQLGEAGYSAPGSEKVAAVPSGSELRYFRADDATEAARLAGQLRQWSVGDLSVKLVRGYEGRLQVRQFELWLARPADDDLARLAQSLNAVSKDERLAAGQTLQSRYTGSPQAIEAVLGLLDAGRIGSLSAEARFNALYFLSRTDPAVWTPALVQRGRAAVARIEERDKSGAAALGPQTRAELNRFVAVLDAVRPGSRPVSAG